MQGWIKLHRQIKEHWLYQEQRKFTKFEAWIDILLEVNHKDNKFLLGSELVEVKRGQTITSIRQLCDRWGWSNTKVTQFLKMLEADGMVTYKSDSKKTVLTVDNYEVYQVSGDEETTVKRQRNDGETTQKHTNKNVKNDKNEKNKSSSPKQVYDTDSIYYQLASRLYNNILANNPDHKKPNLQTWANDVRLMMEQDDRTEAQITYLMDWVQKDSFEMSNVLSTSKLRKRFDELIMKVKREKEMKQGKQYEKPKQSFDEYKGNDSVESSVSGMIWDD